MKIELQTKKIALAVTAAIVLVGGGSAFGARSPSAMNSTAVARDADVLAVERAANGRLLAIGRLDRVSRSTFAVSVLGQKFVLLAGTANERFMSSAKIGQPVALFGEISGGKYFVDAALGLDGQYVQGASKIYLRGSISSIDKKVGLITIGSAQFDTASLASRSTVDRFAKGAMAAAIGTQPQVGGRILVESIRKSAAIDASVGTGRQDASVGTGRPDASVGTGRPDASVGTGRPDASVGTGRPDASVGTGRPDASVGTGRPDASVGTGRPDASVGTGRPDASVGTGRPDASVGTVVPTHRLAQAVLTHRLARVVPTHRLAQAVRTHRLAQVARTHRLARVARRLRWHRPYGRIGWHRPPRRIGWHGSPRRIGWHGSSGRFGWHRPSLTHRLARVAVADASVGTGRPGRIGWHGSPRRIGWHGSHGRVGWHRPS